MIKCKQRLTFLIWIYFAPTLAGKLPHIQLEQHHVDIDLERNRVPEFRCNFQNTEVETKWEFLPELPLSQTKDDCTVHLPIDLTPFDFSIITICLFRNEIDKGLFRTGANINIMGENYANPRDIYDESQAVTGYTLHDPYSLVTGYINKKYFYGSIRFFDSFRLHHVVFYVEPQENAKLYDVTLSSRRRRDVLDSNANNNNNIPTDSTISSSSTDNGNEDENLNAIVFEYVPRVNEQDPPTADEYDDSTEEPPFLPPPPAYNQKILQNDSIIVTENLAIDANQHVDTSNMNNNGDIPNNDIDNIVPVNVNSRDTANNNNDIVDNTSDNNKISESSDSTEEAVTVENDAGVTNTVVSVNTTDNPNTEAGNSTNSSRRRKRRRKRQTKDQKPYSHENILHEDNDIIHSFKFKAGSTSHNIFDVRREDTYLCELCLWIQPNFAQKFSLGGSVQHGVSEVIDIIAFLNSNFRTLDFDEDGLPENIGFVIKSILVNDEIRVTKTGPLSEFPGRPNYEGAYPTYKFSSNIQTISTKSALGLATKHLQDIFKSCCASIGFIYHNMAPALSTTNLRGICTSKNIALVTGLLHSNKIAKYDVYRSVVHSIAHMMGAHHDDVTNLRCHETALYRYLNPFPMHPVQQLNVGMRKNTFRMSSCSKDHITQFLASNGILCLGQVNETFCGNGIVEEGEECDCGAIWQCHLQEECCGEPDTAAGCKITSPFKTQCLRPRVW